MEGSQGSGTATVAWHDIVVQMLKRNEVKLVTYVPDGVLTH
jgi:hypothetical protein